MTSRSRLLVALALKKDCSRLDDCKCSYVSETEIGSCRNIDKGLDTFNIDDYYCSGPVSVPNKIGYTENISTIDDNTTENNIETSNLGTDYGFLDFMDNQRIDDRITSNDESFNKVLNWLNNSENASKDKTDTDLSNKNLYLPKNMNESIHSAKTVNIHRKSSEHHQTKNDKQLPHCDSGNVHCSLDRLENRILNKYNSDKNDSSTSSKDIKGQDTSSITTKRDNKDHCSHDKSESVDDDSRDEDFKIDEYECTESESQASSSVKSDGIIIPPAYVTAVHRVPPMKSVIERIQEQKKKDYRNKQFRCKFCEKEVSSRNFVRHLQGRHNHEREAQDAISFPIKSKERKFALEKLRNDSNFDLYLNGEIRPKKQLTEPKDVVYYPCIYCKGIFSKSYLNRHVKQCTSNKEPIKHKKVNVASFSQTKVACALDSTDVISKLAIRNEVFNMMRADDISFVAKKDLLIVHYGETYLQSQKRERREYSCSNKLRELARLLLMYRSIVSDNSISFKDLLHPKNFDTVVSATRQLCGYDPHNNTYKTPSLAMHMGTTLKLISDELIHLMIRGSKGFQSESQEIAKEWHRNVKNFKNLVEARWNKEISSIANKDLNEKRWRKPLLVPLISDVKKFKEGVLDYAKECERQFLEKNDSDQTYKILVQCTLALLILFNRRRIGDVQYLKVEDYQSDKKTNFQDFEATLSESEKVLTKQYKRVVNGGKGSRAVVILVPSLLQNFLDLMLLQRQKYISSENRYVFALPNSTLKWAQGDVAIRNLTTKFNLENPQAISSNKLRKHIATAMQILSMSKTDYKQFSKFMGHTEKTHEEFYELPVDVFQTARVVKLLIMMEKGIPIEFKGKTLSEIELTPDECVDDDNGKEEQEEIQERENEISSSNDKAQSDDDMALAKRRRKFSDICNVSLKKTKQNVRKGWTSEEVQLIEMYFKSEMDHNKYPSGEKIREFIKINELQRSIPVVKSKFQHLLSLKK